MIGTTRVTSRMKARVTGIDPDPLCYHRKKRKPGDYIVMVIETAA
jgi:hypothetical protein